MSHESGTPLNGIIGFTDLLSNSDLGSSQLEYTCPTVQSPRTPLMQIVNDVLDFQSESGKLELNEEEIVYLN
jgi:signal transduction histidine kinase